MEHGQTLSSLPRPSCKRRWLHPCRRRSARPTCALTLATATSRRPQRQKAEKKHKKWLRCRSSCLPGRRAAAVTRSDVAKRPQFFREKMFPCITSARWRRNQQARPRMPFAEALCPAHKRRAAEQARPRMPFAEALCPMASRALTRLPRTLRGSGALQGSKAPELDRLRTLRGLGVFFLLRPSASIAHSPRPPKLYSIRV